MRRAIGFLVFAVLLGGAIWLGLASQPDELAPLEKVGLAPDIPIPFARFNEFAGVHTSTFSFRPLANDLSREGKELFAHFRKAMPREEWNLVVVDRASDGAWAQVWSKEGRLVQLTYGPELRGSEVELIVEQCPPDPPGMCDVAVLHPFEED